MKLGETVPTKWLFSEANMTKRNLQIVLDPQRFSQQKEHIKLVHCS